MGNSKKKYTIGIDIGGTKILACLRKKDFEVRSEIKVKTKPEKGERFFMKKRSPFSGLVLTLISERTSKSFFRRQARILVPPMSMPIVYFFLELPIMVAQRWKSHYI